MKTVQSLSELLAKLLAISAGVYILVQAAQYVTFANVGWFVIGGVMLVLGGVIFLQKK